MNQHRARSVLAAVFVYLLVTVSFFDTMALLPVLSPFVLSLGAGATLTGVILGAYSLVNMFGNVAAGPFIDAYGRRITIVVGLAVAGSSVAAYAAAVAPWQLLLLRIAHGAGGAVLIPAVFAYAGDRSRRGSVGRSMGYSGAAVATAAFIGPLFGGVGQAVIGIRAVFLCVGLTLMVTAVAVALAVKEQPGERGETPREKRRISARSFAYAVSDPGLRHAYLSVFGLTFAMGILAYTFPLQTASLGMSSAHTGAYFSIFSLSAILVLVSPTNRFSDRYGRRKGIVLGSAAVTVSIGALSMLTSRGLLAAAMLLYGIGYGFMFPSLCAIVVDRTSVSDRGRAFGIFYAVFSLGVFVGPITAGALSGSGVSPYWVAVGVLIVLQSVLALPHFAAQRNSV